jgi:hypothetical protein
MTRFVITRSGPAGRAEYFNGFKVQAGFPWRSGPVWDEGQAVVLSVDSLAECAQDLVKHQREGEAFIVSELATLHWGRLDDHIARFKADGVLP